MIRYKILKIAIYDIFEKFLIKNEMKKKHLDLIGLAISRFNFFANELQNKILRDSFVNFHKSLSPYSRNHTEMLILCKQWTLDSQSAGSIMICKEQKFKQLMNLDKNSIDFGKTNKLLLELGNEKLKSLKVDETIKKIKKEFGHFSNDIICLLLMTLHISSYIGEEPTVKYAKKFMNAYPRHEITIKPKFSSLKDNPIKNIHNSIDKISDEFNAKYIEEKVYENIWNDSIKGLLEQFSRVCEIATKLKEKGETKEAIKYVSDILSFNDPLRISEESNKIENKFLK